MAGQRPRKGQDDADHAYLVGMATCGIAAGARPVLTTIVGRGGNKRELHRTFMVTQTGCIGICQFEPIVEVVDENGTDKITYVKMTPEKALRVVNDHIGQRQCRHGIHHRRKFRNKEAETMYRSNVLVCGGTGCTSSNSEKIIEKLKEEISAKGLEQEVNVVRTGCFGLCALGPIMIVYPEGAFYSHGQAGRCPGNR